MVSYRPTVWLSLLLAMAVGLGFGGCGIIAVKPPAETEAPPAAPWDPAVYAEFVAENMAFLNRYYSDEYAPYPFVVDTPGGSTLIQALMAFEQATLLVDRLDIGHLSDAGKTAVILDHVRDHYAYRLAPNRWASAAEVAETGRGDCKGLSLLLLSLLEAADVQAYAAIANGHMWVNAYYDHRWHVLETDTDAQRRRIYQTPGFYDAPLYKIYADKTLKRVSLHPAPDD